MRYFLKSIGVHFRSGRVLFLLTVLGVALGVASVLSIQIINLNALGAFEGSLKAISGEADLSVVGRIPTIPETAYSELLSVAGVAGAWPLYRLDVALAGRSEFYLEVLGTDLFAPLQLPWHDAPGETSDPLTVPGWTAISPELAAELELQPGDSYRVSSGSRFVELTVGALVDFRRISPLASTRLVVMDVAQAQDRFGQRGSIHQIDVALREGADLKRTREKISERLGPAVEIVTPEQRRQAAAGLLGAFRLNLTALSLVSLFVGGFLVYASTEASLVRRRNEFGLLRCIGFTRRQLLVLMLGEVALLGVLGVLVGVPLGYAVAVSNVDMVSATLSNLYLLREIETLRLPVWLLPLAALIGVGCAAGGAIMPTIDMSRRDTRTLLAAYTLQERATGFARPMLLAGCALIAGTSLIWALWARDWPPGGFLLGSSLLIGLPLMTPWVVHQATRRMRTPRLGLRYGIKALGLRLHATAFSVAALAVAVSMLLAVTLMIGSFRRTVEIWIQATLQADVYVTTESWRRARTAATLDPEALHALRDHPGVAEIDRLRQFFAYSGERRISVVGVDMGLASGSSRFELLAGDAQEAFTATRDRDAVIISEPLARKAGLGVGDLLEISGPDGPVSFPIVGVSYDYSNESGGVAMDLDTLRRSFGPGPVNNAALYLEPGVDADRVIGELRERFRGRPLEIRGNAELRQEVFRIFDQTFAVTRLLQLMSLIIAACGITLTLIVLARERIAELALYRALGASRSQVFRVFLGKGLGIGLFGLGLGAIGGVALAMILIFLINRAYFGWTIAVHWPWGALVFEAATILAAAVVSSLYPALRASRTPAMELSRENL